MPAEPAWILLRADAARRRRCASPPSRGNLRTVLTVERFDDEEQAIATPTRPIRPRRLRLDVKRRSRAPSGEKIKTGMVWVNVFFCAIARSRLEVEDERARQAGWPLQHGVLDEPKLVCVAYARRIAMGKVSRHVFTTTSRLMIATRSAPRVHGRSVTLFTTRMTSSSASALAISTSTPSY